MERYDWESGLVYRETVVRRPLRGANCKPSWDHACSQLKLSYVPSPQNSLSLCETAIRKIVRNADALVPESLGPVPTIMVQKIWKEIRQEGRESLHIWKVFIHSGHSEKHMSHNVHVPLRACPLVNLFTQLDSPTFLWTTDLLLSDVQCSAADLKALTRLSTLQNLHVFQSIESPIVSAFDDGVLSYLSSRAAEQGVLSRLEMVSLFNTPGITLKSNESLSRFPALDVFCTYKTGIRTRDCHNFSNVGWNAENGSFTTLLNSISKKIAYQRHISHFTMMFKDLMFEYLTMRRSTSPSEANGLPMLYASIGATRHSSASRAFQPEEILCFERSRHVERPMTGSLSAGSRNADRVEPMTALTGPAGAKRRKLKDSKSVALHTYLDNI